MVRTTIVFWGILVMDRILLFYFGLYSYLSKKDVTVKCGSSFARFLCTHTG